MFSVGGRLPWVCAAGSSEVRMQRAEPESGESCRGLKVIREFKVWEGMGLESTRW